MTSKTCGIIVAGAPASGKGTQCDYIKTEFGYIHLSTGDLLRAEIAAGSELGKKSSDIMKSGGLVPDEIVIGIIQKRLEQDDIKKNGFLLDGFPRTVEQAKALAKLDATVLQVIVLEVSEEELIKRACGRRIDPQTNISYHIHFNPPPNEEIAKRLIQRSDDTEVTVKGRLGNYNKYTTATIPFYDEMGIVAKVDASGKIEEVWKLVKASIQTLHKK